MLIVLGALLVVLVLVVLAIIDDPEYLFGAVLFSVIFGVIIFFTLFTSYDNYLDRRSFYDATVTQYRDQIKMYKNEAQIDIKAVAYTDFKYQGYQKEIAENIRTLTDGVVRYNKSIIQKRIMKNNIIFSWLIVAPDDDMVIISLTEKRK